MEDSKSNKHLPRLREQGLNDKRVELFDELIHPEYNSHNAYVEPGRRALSILSAPPRTKIYTGGRDNANEEPGEVARRYMQSTEFADDIRNFNVSDIVGVESTILIPSTNSPLK
jgi:hypothetical protein